jgi:hypothetical protein
MANSRNLAQRLAKPAKGRGRVQRAARRLFYTQATISTASVAAFAYAKKTLLRGRRLAPEDYRHVRRALAEIAIPIGRAVRMGRPIVWRLKD